MKLNRAENIAWLSELLKKKLQASLPSFGGYFHQKRCITSQEQGYTPFKTKLKSVHESTVLNAISQSFSQLHLSRNSGSRRSLDQINLHFLALYTR